MLKTITHRDERIKKLLWTRVVVVVVLVVVVCRRWGHWKNGVGTNLKKHGQKYRARTPLLMGSYRLFLLCI